jgi:hypothetical protein
MWICTGRGGRPTMPASAAAGALLLLSILPFAVALSPGEPQYNQCKAASLSLISTMFNLTCRTLSCKLVPTCWLVCAEVTTPAGQALFGTPGAFVWIAPDEVFSVSVVCVGGGGGSGTFDPAILQGGAAGGGGKPRTGGQPPPQQQVLQQQPRQQQQPQQH